MTNDTPLEALRHKISLFPGTFRSKENSPGKNKLWRAIGQPLHKRSQQHKILQITKEAHGLVDHSFYFWGGVVAGILPGTLPTYSIFWVLYRQYSTRNFFLLEVMCEGSSVLWGTNQLHRFFCSVRNKPQFLSLSFYVSLHVVTILYVSLPHVLTIPLFLCEPTCSQNLSPHSLGQKHREIYMSLHGLTLYLMFTRAS